MSKVSSFQHIPVLFAESLEALAIRADGVYLDCTTGGAGHSCGILRQLGKGGRLLALDRDEAALTAARERLAAVETSASWDLIQSPFAEFPAVLADRGLSGVDGILADLGVSSAQLDQAERGFAYMQDGPLDMRMDPSSGQAAADWLASVSETELRQVLFDYGEERYGARIARAICLRRESRPFLRTLDLADCIVMAQPPQARREKQHPAKRSFQAIRIAVNAELKQLETLLTAIPRYLNPGGRAALISFHSLEDRLIKQAMKHWEEPCTCPKNLPCTCGLSALGQRLHKQGVVAQAEEIEANPRSRSARLRIFERNEQAYPVNWI